MSKSALEAMDAWIEHHRCERAVEAKQMKRYEAEFGSDQNMRIVIGYQETGQSVFDLNFETILRRDFENECWRVVEPTSADWDLYSLKLVESV